MNNVGDMAAYRQRPELPGTRYEALVLAAEKGNAEEVRKITQSYRISKLQDVTAFREQHVRAGNQLVSSDLMNPLHLAVYNKHLEVVKELVQNVPFNVLMVGKMPSSSGLAKESEVTIEAIVFEGEDMLPGSVADGRVAQQS